MARLVLARAARLQILGLDWLVRGAVDDALGVLERDPYAGYPLRGRRAGLRALRVGSFRVIYQLLEDDATVRVVTIKHRGTAYRADPR